MKRIGLFGGTFDPPHRGHLMIANAAMATLDLEEVWFIPTYEPPHKSTSITSSKHRLRMLELMLKQEERFRLEDIEIKRKGRSYTIDTVTALLARYPGVAFYFIIGADQVARLESWQDIEKLQTLVTFVGFERPGVAWRNPCGVMKLPHEQMDISSTEIRNKLMQHQDVTHLLDQEIYDYIKEHDLYGN